MTTTIIAGSEVTRPTTTPLKSSVLDHATVVTNEREFGLINDAGLYPSYNCIETLTPTALCADPTQDKEFNEAGWQPGLTFAVYGGVKCKALGLDREDQKRELARVFALNEGKGIEQVLLYNRFVATDSDQMDDLGQPQMWDDPVDLTPGTDITLATALALLEGYAARVYAGVPTIHMPRAAASLLNERIVWAGDLAFTRSGSKVAFGGGYDDETMLASGEWDLYATGEVYVERSSIVDVQTYELSGANAADDIDSNTVLGLVERMFRVSVDCFVAKATGTVWA